MTGNEEFTGPIINRDFVTGPSSSTRAESSFEGCVGTKVPFFPSPFWRKKVVRVVFLLPDPEHLSIFLHAIYTDSDSSPKHRISCKIFLENCTSRRNQFEIILCYVIGKNFSIGDKLSVAGMAGSMGQAGMGSYYGPAAAYGSLSAASMAAAAAAAAQQSAAAMSAGLAAPAQVSRCAC